MKPFKVFISYSHQDEELKNELLTHLFSLKRKKLISEWHDRVLLAGVSWNKKISQELLNADIILLLISPDFIASDYCFENEVKIALELHEKEESKVIPIILRPCDWASFPFGQIQGLPIDAKPITMWNNRDEAYLSIIEGIKKSVENWNLSLKKKNNNTDLNSIYKSEPYLEISLSNSNIQLSDFSDSTISFLNQNFQIDDKNNISLRLIEEALKNLSDTENNLYNSVEIVREELKSMLEISKEYKSTKAFFIDTVKRNPIWCKFYKHENTSYIISFYGKFYDGFGHAQIQHICILNLYANKWQIHYDSPLEEFPCWAEISNCKIILHDEKTYFYFERVIQQMGTMNNGFGNIEFTILDFEQKILSKLNYNGIRRKNAIDGNFNLESSVIHSQIHRFMLEKGASKSNNIYRTPEDYDIDAKENCIRKWDVENPDYYGNDYGYFRFFLYEECIFFGIDDYPSIEEYKKDTSYVENEEYLLFYYFAGPIVAFEKVKQRYFIVFVPKGWGLGDTWGLRSINSVEFITNNKIIIKNEYESYEIDLDTGEYRYKYFGA